MPLLKLQTSAKIPDNKRDALLKACSRIVTEITGKPEAYVMVTLEQVAGCLAGDITPLAFADIRGIGGLDKATNARLSASIGALLQDELGIPPDKTYLTFTDVPADHWGWNGRTFG